MAFLACNVICLSPVHDDLRGWNKNIKKQVLKGNVEKAILTYLNMQELGYHADNYTFPILLKAAGNLLNSCFGCSLHGVTIKTGFSSHAFVQTALLNMYSSLGFICDACKVFENMPVKDVVAWNSMLHAYVSSGQMDNATEIFESMPLKDLSSFNIMVSGYGSTGRIISARSIFNKIPTKDAVSWNTMILAYTNAGDMAEAQKLFNKMPAKNVITWNTMVRGYIHNQLYAEAVDLFDEMQAGNVMPDFLTMTGVLSACAHLGSLERGTKIHIYAKSHCLDSSPHVTTALIVMYAKCGSIVNALVVFYKFQFKDIYCWNAIISGLALHGYGNAALGLFDKMRENCIMPDDITFIGLLSACSHAGLVKDGCKLFNCMEKVFGITPKREHYGCMVDLLGRAKLLNHAFQLIQAMPFEPGESVLGALLSACVIDRDLDTGEKVMKLYFDRSSSHFSDGELMMFANLYASCGKWEEAKMWREKMNDSGIAKTAGCSIIELNGNFHKFLAGEIGIDLKP
jgi:pentatricopeptide repeat protein